MSAVLFDQDGITVEIDDRTIVLEDHEARTHLPGVDIRFKITMVDIPANRAELIEKAKRWVEENPYLK